MNARVLICCPFLRDADEDLASMLADAGIEVVERWPAGQQLSENELVEIIGDFDGILCGDEQINAAVLAAAPRLRVISKWGVGTDGIDHAAAGARGIVVRRTPDVFAAEVAEVVLGYCVMLTRRLHTIDREVRRGTWLKPRGRTLAGQTLGIVGLGSTGRATAKRARAFGMTVLATDPAPTALANAEAVGAELCERADLLSRSHIIALQCALNDDTRHLINAGTIASLRRGVLLVNVSRGALVEEEALVSSLQSGHIAAAALDVFETEPLPAGHALTQLDNVILGAHNASNTVEAVARTNRAAVKNLIEELRNV